jgi:hypothetical protein
MVKYIGFVFIASCAITAPDYMLTGAGGATATSSSVASSAVTSGSTGGMCSESPCKLTAPQCGCEPGQKCALSVSVRVCTANGTTGLGEDCVSVPCVAGLYCEQLTGQIAICEPFCSSDADCTAPGFCDNIAGASANDKACTASCNPLTNAGCVSGTACRFELDMTGMHIETFCAAVGAGLIGAPCNKDGQCGVAMSCQSNQCFALCDVNAPACANCVAFQSPNVIKGIALGVCD